MSPQGASTRLAARVFTLALALALTLAGAGMAGAVPPGVPLACPATPTAPGTQLVGFAVAVGAALAWARWLRSS